MSILIPILTGILKIIWKNREEEKAQWGTVAIVNVRDESMNQWRPGRLSESSHYLKIDPGL